MGRVRSVIDTIQEHDSPERFCKLGAAVRFGEPHFIDDHTVDLDGARLTARAWIVAINGGVKLSTLAGAIHAYPTLAEISKKAAGSYYSEKLFGDRTKKILRFLFDLKGRACAPEEEVSG